MYKFILSTLVLVFFNGFANAQGCIVVRNISGFGQYNHINNSFDTSLWQLNITSRYFKSYHDYRGTVNLHTPEQDEAVVKSFSTDFYLSRLMKNGWSVALSLPISANARTESKAHGGAGTTRYTTNTFGLGDLRFTVYKWLLKTTVSQKGNIQLGLGIKLPTGDYKYQDYFHRNDTTKVLAPVNPSIQLGDGGTGIITELNTFYFFNRSFNIYGNFYYLINPRDQNGVSVTGGRTPTTLQVATGNDITSVPDVYSIRAGLNYNYSKFSFSAGLRQEGSPVNDLFGGSYGVRRPGYNLSFDPGIVYMMKKVSLYLYVPIIIARTIKQNVPDANATKITGIYTSSPGGSGDYSVFLGVQFSL